MNVKKFQNIVWEHYTNNKRDLPWRQTHDPYSILVSEIMLQQTQVRRVLPKYTEWLNLFPSFKHLSQAPLHKVLKAWQGLGYNRRGLNLKKTSDIIVKKYNGHLPSDKQELLELPGIGPYTSGALQAFIWNKPVIFIETNIRTVFIHHFFNDKKDIHDKEILPYIEKTLKTENVREWYYALMDYGTNLKKNLPNPNRASKHYTKQTPFKDSNRELRSLLLQYILTHQPVSQTQILTNVKGTDGKKKKNLKALVAEGFIKETENVFVIS